MKQNSQISHTDVLWHPNFRVVATLPDTKVIRTAFLVNAVAGSLLVVVLFALVSRELALGEVRAELGSVETTGVLREIADGQPKLTQMSKLQGDFAAAEAKLREIEGFVSSPLVGSVFLSDIARTLPRLIVINAIEYREGNVVLQGTVVGASERATVLAKQYAEQLASEPAFASTVAKVQLRRLEREKTTGRLSFEIDMALKLRK